MFQKDLIVWKLVFFALMYGVVSGFQKDLIVWKLDIDSYDTLDRALSFRRTK